MDVWIDYEDPAIIEGITGDSSTTEGVADAVEAACEILTMLTGYRVHAAGTATQEYTINGPLTRLTPNYRPVTSVVSVESVSYDCETVTDVTAQFCLFAGAVRPTVAPSRAMSLMDIARCNMCASTHDRLRMTYTFASTVGAAAKRAAIVMSRQFWLFDHPEAGECILPERVTSVSREGLTYSFLDPMTFLDDGRTGVPTVDSFLAAVNPSKAKIPAAIYIPEAPPGVIR